MEKINSKKRDNLNERLEEVGLLYHRTNEGEDYWVDDRCYKFTSQEINNLESATNELHQLCLDAVQNVIDDKRYEELKIPAEFVPTIERSWNEDSPSVYGRFDLAYDGKSIKMLEYNADTPTMLLESSIVQWFWLKDVFPDKDQFNTIHEKLIDSWKRHAPNLKSSLIHFGHIYESDNTEDTMTINYLRDTAEQAGLLTEDILMQDIGHDKFRKQFVDYQEKDIKSIFKLYPWEWMINEEFGKHIAETYDKTQWIEPAWKMILSNKGILPILWELNPNHPNLLECYKDGHHGLVEYVKKPIFSREGSNVSIKTIDGLVESHGEYGEEGFIFQKYQPLPVFDGKRPIIGSWVIDGESAGIGIRETSGLITNNNSNFAPHYFD